MHVRVTRNSYLSCNPPPQLTRLWVRQDRYLHTVTAEHGLATGYVYWLVDGEFAGRSTGTLALHRGRTVPVEAFLSRHRDLRPAAFERRRPRPTRWTLEWLASTDAVDTYRLEYATGISGGDWTTFETVVSTGAWVYTRPTPVLTDLTWYRFRVVPVAGGNDGTPLEWAARRCVRIPDAVATTATYDPVAQELTSRGAEAIWR